MAAKKISRQRQRPVTAKKKATPKKEPTPKKPTPKKKATRKAVDTITIGVTPPWLAPDSKAHDTYKLVANKATRPSPEELSSLPWMQQDEAYRAGYYMLTHGLQQHADHLEIELCNVPGALVAAGMKLLNSLGDYVLGGAKLQDGETMQMQGESLSVIGFREIAPGTSGTDHGGPVLRVVFLC